MFGMISGICNIPVFRLDSLSGKGKFAWEVRSEKTKYEWKLRLISAMINLVPSGGVWCDGSLNKREKRQMISIDIVAVPKSIVDTRTCENFERRELNVQKFFDTPRLER